MNPRKKRRSAASISAVSWLFWWVVSLQERWNKPVSANSFDIEISDKQKIESLIWSITRNHLVISKSWLKGCVTDTRAHHESKEGYSALCRYEQSNSMWFYGNKSWFFHLSPFSCFTPKQSHTSSPWKASIPRVRRSWLPACELLSQGPHLMCLCLLRGSGGDWNSLCEMIFEVIKESHSVGLTVLMESRNCSSSP